jgi:hypothetical protein
MDLQEDDIEADIRAAMSGDAAPIAVVADTPAKAPEPAEANPAGAPARDATGKFAPKTEGAAPVAPVKIDNAAPPGLEAPKEPIRPPEGLSAPVKAMWATLPPEVQQDIDRRERESQTAIQERGAKLNQLEPIAKALEPIQGRLTMAGIDGATYVRALVSADEQLRGPNGAQALMELARQYGIRLPQGVQQGTQAQQQQPQVHPVIERLQRQVSELTQQNQQAQQAAQTQQQTQIQSTIDAFAKDHLYFENVKPRIAALLASGHAADLKDAYEQACWADPVVRPLFQAEQAKPTGAQEQQRAKVQQAKQAGSSITGAPGVGGSPTRTSNPNNSVEDDVREAVASLRV